MGFPIHVTKDNSTQDTDSSLKWADALLILFVCFHIYNILEDHMEIVYGVIHVLSLVHNFSSLGLSMGPKVY